MVTQYAPEFDVPPGSSLIPPDLSQLKGSQIWKTWDLATWTQVTNNGFGDKDIVNFEAFTAFDGKLYVSGSKGASSTPSGLGGAKIFRQVCAVECPSTTTTTAPSTTTTSTPVTTTSTIPTTTTTIEEPTLIDLVRFEASGKLARIFLKWETASEIDNMGFNIYRAESEDGEYVKINARLFLQKAVQQKGRHINLLTGQLRKEKPTTISLKMLICQALPRCMDRRAQRQSRCI